MGNIMKNYKRDHKWFMVDQEITIRDEFDHEWPEHDEFDFAKYEEPKRIVHHGTVAVIQKTLGPHYLNMTLLHNGNKPGDSGNGGYVTLMFNSDYIDNDYEGSISVRAMDARTILFEFNGEWERLQMVKVLETAVNELKKIK